MKKSDRLIAFETLHKIFTDNSYSNIAIDNALVGDDNDNAFITALVYGTTERLITLDYFINKYIDKKPKPKIMTILRLGAYQLIFMDKVPNSAAINESVKLVKDIKQDYYTSLVNAVLRKISEDNENVNDIIDKSIKYSVPENLINMLTKAYGEENVQSVLDSLNGAAPVFATPNTRFVNADELLYELNCDNIDGEVIGDLVKITGPFNLQKSNAFKNGLFHIEDKSCYECCKALDVSDNIIVLDMCAAPGGKSYTISELMHDTGNIYSFDLYEHRVNLIKDGAKRLGITNITALVNNAETKNDDLPKADRILCDVPCSGFGIMRRKPEIRYKELDSIKDLPNIQYKILSASALYLKCGGKMIYSTCTLNHRENEKVVERFLKEHNGFLLDFDKTVFPTIDGGDGFYFAVLKKINED